MSTDPPWSAHSTPLHWRDPAGWKCHFSFVWSPTTQPAAKQRHDCLVQLRQCKVLLQERTLLQQRAKVLMQEEFGTSALPRKCR